LLTHLGRGLLAVALGGATLLPARPEISPPAARRPSDWANQVTLTKGWEFVRGDVGGIWTTLRSDDRALGLPVWESVALPHCVNAFDAVDPDTPYYQGPAWYRTQLDVANPYAGGRTLLHFEGSGQRTEVWIGDRRVAEHVGGYDEFTVDITDAVAAWRASALARLPATESRIAPGRVPLAVRCDNSRDVEMIPSDLSDFNRYGGLYRPVHLVYLPAGGIERVHADASRRADGEWQVEIKAFFHGSRESGGSDREITARVVAPDGREVLAVRLPAPKDDGPLVFPRIGLPEPRLWSPESPALYGVEVIAGESRAWTRFGLRMFEFVEKGPFKLNGERLLLRGTHRHEDHAGLGAAMTDELMEKEMRLMKEMGVNFIRLGHYQQSRRILELCDELGLLVWEEIPWCRGGLGGERYRAQTRAMLRAMIDQHRNHPSIILWGLGNENDWPGDFPEFDEEKIRAFMRELNDLAHALDPMRLTSIRRCEFCRDLVDVYSPSIWAGWYGGQFTEYAASMRRHFEQSPRVVHAEWGGDSHAGRHAEDPYARLREIATAGATEERGLDFMAIGGKARVSRDGEWSESYICELIDWHLKEQEKMPWLTGSAMWVFKDFSTPLRPENPVPFVNQKGAVERDLTPKESYYVYQSYWATAPMVRVYGHAWPVRWGAAGEKRWVHVYSNCPEVELWLNGVSQGVKRRDGQDFPAAGLRWALPFVEGMNTLRAVGRRDGQVVSDETTFRYETRKWGAPDHLRLQQLPAPEGRVRVQVELLDAKGVVCLDATDPLRFGHAGDGRLRDNLGTAGASRVVQLANGRAQIDVELPAAGVATVSATVKDVPTAMLRVAWPAEPFGDETPEEIFTDVAQFDRERVLRLAAEAMRRAPVSLRAVPLPAFAEKSGAVPGDFLSMGDYWWPDPAKPDGLPYVRRDGETNPGNFEDHRRLMRQMRDNVAALAAAYAITHDDAQAQRAAEWLRVFFVDPATRMNPHLRFAQAIPGVSSGRGIGIIDTLHLVEVPLAARAIAGAPGLPAEVLPGVKAWFAEYLQWMLTHPNGKEEAAAKNNHSVAYWLQVAVFARFTGDAAALETARRTYREVLLPGQLAFDGSFPRELARTKPYGYSIFQADNMALLTDVLSSVAGGADPGPAVAGGADPGPAVAGGADPGSAVAGGADPGSTAAGAADPGTTESSQSTGVGAPGYSLWTERLPDGRGVAQAVAFLAPYLADRDAWPYAKDIAHFDGWPARSPTLLLGGFRLRRPDYLAVWRRLPADPTDEEVRRNQAMTQPILWLLPAAQ
jgi:beta-galactosidase